MFTLEVKSSGEVGEECIDIEFEKSEKTIEGPIVLINSFEEAVIKADNIQLMIKDESKTKLYPQTKIIQKF